MKRITTIVLFASIFAVTIGTLGFSGTSASSLMVSSVPQSQESVGMLGHVEYKVLDEIGNVKAYMQNDNIVVQVGKDCVARAVFANGTNPGACPSYNEFQYISIGNNTGGTVDDTQTGLAGAQCASSGANGEMSRRQVTPTFVAAGAGTGTIVTLDTSGAPFTFVAGVNNTSVVDSGVFNRATTQNGEGHCTALGTTEMFSIQQLNGATGIAVSGGDSLSVKWTITVG